METNTTQAEHIEDIWKYAFGVTPAATVKCAIELQIYETVESHGGSITLPELSTALGCSSPSALHRIMRYLIHHGFFKQDPSSGRYSQTPRSRLLSKDGMASIIMYLNSPVMVPPWQGLSRFALANDGTSPFRAVHDGLDLWEYAVRNPDHRKLINDAMACKTRVGVTVIIDDYPEPFEGIGSLVDVGGGNGMSLSMLVKAFPWIRGINFDLPQAVSVAPRREGVEHVGGSMFETVPKADAAFIMSVLLNWGDEECIHILRNCKSAIPKDTGKVIVVEPVIRDHHDEGKDDKYEETRLALDMALMVHTERGKVRTFKELEHLVNAAGFSKYTVKHIHELSSVIVAYP